MRHRKGSVNFGAIFQASVTKNVARKAFLAKELALKINLYSEGCLGNIITCKVCGQDCERNLIWNRSSSYCSS